MIHRLTGGIPRRINTLCNRLLLAAFLSEKHILNAATPAIALEINEVGHDLVLQPPAEDTIPSTTAIASPPRAETRMWHMHFEKIEKAIDLERSAAQSISCTRCCIGKASHQAGQVLGQLMDSACIEWDRSPASSGQPIT